MERKKLARLTDRITDRFGTRPAVYLAGRYGLGPNTAAILEELGYEVDLSPCVPMDFTADGGPDYSGATNHPYWFGEGRRLLGLPCSGDFVGWMPGSRRRVYRLAADPRLAWSRLPGILARLGASSARPLARGIHTRGAPPPDTIDAESWISGLRLQLPFSLSATRFHPYVRDGRDLEAFLANCRASYSSSSWRNWAALP